MRKNNLIESIIVRQPIYSINKHLSIPSNKTELNDFYRALYNDQEFKEAIFLASPELYYEWKKGIDSKSDKFPSAILKYYLRSFSNTVPFGLFGSYSKIPSEKKSTEYTRYSNIDMDFVIKLTTILNNHSVIKNIVQFRINNTIYRHNKKYRYIESKIINDKIDYTLSSLDYNELLDHIFNLETPSHSFFQLKDIIKENVEDVDDDTAEYFVNELIEANIFISSLETCLNEEKPFTQIITFLSNNYNSIKVNPELLLIYDTIIDLQKKLDEIDIQVFNKVEVYEQFFDKLKTLDIPFNKKYVINSNLFKNNIVGINRESLDKKIERLIEILTITSKSTISYENRNLKFFKENFSKKYEQAEVPLLEIFDNELGITYIEGMSEGYVFSSLIDDIEMPSYKLGYMLSSKEPAIFKFWANLLMNNKHEEIDLSKEDLSVFQDIKPPYTNKSNSYGTSSLVLNYADDKLVLKNAGGTSALNLLGRFSNNDKVLQDVCDEITQIEDEIFKDKIVAEIIHLPNSRAGNVLIRKVNRKHEISIISKNSEKSDNIDLSDILISMSGNRIILKSRKHNKEIIPYLASAQNYHFDSLPIYQFLCDLQQQDRSNFFGLNMGGLEADDFNYFPRISYGQDVIIRKATWQLKIKNMVLNNQSKVDENAFNSYKAEYKIPRFINITDDGTDKMIIDTENSNTLNVLLDELNKNKSLTITEFVYDIDAPETYLSELICSLKPKDIKPVESYYNINSYKAQREFKYGDEWVYVKLYTGLVTADHVLSEYIKPCIESLLNKKLITKWFFIRYTDPDFHIRLRFKLKNKASFHDGMNQLDDLVSLLYKEKRIWKTQYSNYNRELGRYLDENIDCAESIFSYDSDFCLNLINLFRSNEEIENNNWMYIMRSIDQYFDSFKFDLDKKLEVITRMFLAFWDEFDSNKAIKRSIDNKFRSNINEIVTVIESNDIVGAEYYNERRKKIELLDLTNLSQDELEYLFPSYIHMNVNRIIKASPRFHEMMIYGLLQKFYKRKIGIQKYKTLSK